MTFAEFADKHGITIGEARAIPTRSEVIEETESDLRRRFIEEIQPHVIEQYGESDTVALNEAFNNWTDSLCKDGEISEEAYNQVSRTDD